MKRNVVRRAFSLTCALSVVSSACHHSTSAESPVEAPQVSSRIPRDAARFSIDSTSDTTVLFRPVEARWLQVGMRAHVVDPAQRDALIARLTITSVDTLRVVAKITGKVSQVSASHAVLVERPDKRWWRDHRFWFGAIAGGTIGALVGSAH